MLGFVPARPGTRSLNFPKKNKRARSVGTDRAARNPCARTLEVSVRNPWSVDMAVVWANSKITRSLPSDHYRWEIVYVYITKRAPFSQYSTERSRSLYGDLFSLCAYGQSYHSSDINIIGGESWIFHTEWVLIIHPGPLFARYQCHTKVIHDFGTMDGTPNSSADEKVIDSTNFKM